MATTIRANTAPHTVIRAQPHATGRTALLYLHAHHGHPTHVRSRRIRTRAIRPSRPTHNKP